jgi:hypothetical protein
MKLPRGWNEWQLTELDRRWRADETASSIGRAIGKTKDAVIGMSHRRDLPKRLNPIFPLMVPAPYLPLRPRSICQWIEGAPTAFDSCKCGAKPLSGEVYCGFHREKSSAGTIRRRRFIPKYLLPTA